MQFDPAYERQIRDDMWAAGIIDGEGCFTKIEEKKKGVQTGWFHCRVQVEMSDFDTIHKLQKTFGGVGCLCDRSEHNAKIDRKPTIRWYVNKQKDVFDILIRIMPYLSARRRAKAKELFAYLEPKVVR